ncbi:unnamed protein product [Arabidopsis halleri]
MLQSISLDLVAHFSIGPNDIHIYIYGFVLFLLRFFGRFLPMNV